MKKHAALFVSLALWLSASVPAFAAEVDTTKVYNSGFLVMAFLGFCALIVTAQLIPAIILMIGSLRSMFSEMSKKKAHARIKS